MKQLLKALASKMKAEKNTPTPPPNFIQVLRFKVGLMSKCVSGGFICLHMSVT